jgi:hypothetical protein
MRVSPTPPSPQKQNGCLIGLGVIFILVCLVGLIGSITDMMETPQQKAAREAQEWFGSASHISCENHLKEQLRDPDSYERNGDFIGTPSKDGKTRMITWDFRSKNGFGGYTPATAMCLISKENGGTVEATVLGQ